MKKIYIDFSKSDLELKKVLLPIHGHDLANVIFNYSNANIVRVLNCLETPKLIETFNEIKDQDHLFEIIDDGLKKRILNNLEMDNLKFFIQEGGSQYTDLLTPTKQKIIKSLLEYNEDIVASIMTTDFLVVNANTARDQAINHIIYNSKNNDYLDTVFVVDADNKYLGQVELRTLLNAKTTDKVQNLIDKDDSHILFNDTIEAAIKIVKDYDLKVLPILENNAIVGIVTASDIYEELVEYHEETFAKISLTHDTDENSSVFKRVKTRLPWLLLSVILNILIASFLTIFEDTLAAVTALALFQPMILGMSGNISTQSLAVTILQIHESEIENTKVPKSFLLKEFLIGVINAILISIIAFIFVFSLSFVLNFLGTDPLKLSLTVSISMLISLFVSAFIGSAIPLICKKFKIDPVAASGPILTTINDLFSLFVYFGIATLLILSL